MTFHLRAAVGVTVASLLVGVALWAARSRPRVSGDRPGLAFERERGGFGVETAHLAVHLERTGAASVSALDLHRRPRATLQLGAARVGRGGRELLRGELQARPDGALARGDGAVSEVVQALDVGVEERWELAARPAGQGELEVRIPVREGTLLRATDAGLHFGVHGRPALRYGAATFVDADGVKTTVRPAYQAGEIVLRVPGDALERARYPAVLDPTISAELTFDQPIIGAWPGTSDVQTASTSGITLVTWVDTRLGGRFLATRLDSSGNILDATPIDLGPTSQSGYLRVGGGNGVFTVAIYEPVYTLNSADRIYVLQLDAATGQITLPRTLITSTAYAGYIDHYDVLTGVVYGAGEFVILFEIEESQNAFISEDMYISRVLSDGTVLDAAPKLVSSPGKPSAIASNGTSFMVAFFQSAGTANNITLAVMDANGNLGATGTAGSIPASLASDGTNYVGLTGASTTVSSVYVDGTTAAGTELAPIGYGRGYESIVFDGQGYFAVFPSPQLYNSPTVSLKTAALDTTGALRAGQPVQFETIPVEAVAAASLSSGVASFIANRSGPEGDGLYRQDYFEADGGYDPNLHLVATMPGPQHRASVATDGTNYFLAWADWRGATGWDIYGAIVDPSGALLTPPDLAISAAAGEQSNPSVAFDGTNFMVVWQDGRNADGGDQRDVYGAAVARDGGVLDPDGFAIASHVTDERHPAIASAAGQSLVAWETAADQGIYTATGITGVLLDDANRTTTALGSLSSSAAAQGNGYPVAVATDGGYFIAFHSDNAVVRAGSGLTDVVFVSPAGAVSPLANPSAESGSQRGVPAITTDGAEAMICDGVEAYVFTSTGRVAQADLTNSYHYGVEPAVAWDGQFFDAVVTGYDGNEWGLTFDRQLNLRTTVDLLVPDGGGPAFPVSLSATLDRDFLLAYERSFQNLGTDRVAARLVSMGEPNGTACAEASDCHSGICATGYCCDTPCGDADACNGVESCASGTCQAGTPITCTPPDACHDSGVCNSADGGCTFTALTGTACPGGTCQAGVCVLASSGSSSASSSSSGSSSSTASSSGGSSSSTTGGTTTGGTTSTSSTSSASSTSSSSSTSSTTSSGTSSTGASSTTGGSHSTSSSGATSTGGGGAKSSGCGCSASAAGGSGLWIFALGALVLRQRRRRPTSP